MFYCKTNFSVAKFDGKSFHFIEKESFLFGSENFERFEGQGESKFNRFNKLESVPEDLTFQL